MKNDLWSRYAPLTNVLGNRALCSSISEAVASYWLQHQRVRPLRLCRRFEAGCCRSGALGSNAAPAWVLITACDQPKEMGPVFRCVANWPDFHQLSIILFQSSMTISSVPNLEVSIQTALKLSCRAQLTGESTRGRGKDIRSQKIAVMITRKADQEPMITNPSHQRKRCPGFRLTREGRRRIIQMRM